MSSDLDMCNQALSHIGKNQIQSFDQRGPEAEQCKIHFQPALEAALAAFDWNFARVIKTLPQLTGITPAWPFGFAFTYPADCVRIRRVVPLGARDPRDEIRYSVGRNPAGGNGRVIYTVREAPTFIYTTSAVDLASVDQQFVELFSWHMATRLAMPLTKDLKLRNEMFRMVQAFKTPAEAANANEGDEARLDNDPDWITARG